MSLPGFTETLLARGFRRVCERHPAPRQHHLLQPQLRGRAEMPPAAPSLSRAVSSPRRTAPPFRRGTGLRLLAFCPPRLRHRRRPHLPHDRPPLLDTSKTFSLPRGRPPSARLSVGWRRPLPWATASTSLPWPASGPGQVPRLLRPALGLHPPRGAPQLRPAEFRPIRLLQSLHLRSTRRCPPLQLRPPPG